MKNSQSINKPDSIDFECCYCGHYWVANKHSFRMITRKVNPDKFWIDFITICPNCKRECTEHYKMKGEN